MESSLKENEEKKKEKLTEKVLDNFGLFALIFLLSLVVIYFIFTNKIDYAYTYLWNFMFGCGKEVNLSDLCVDHDVGFFHLTLSRKDILKAVIIIGVYIGLFESLTAIPENVQQITFGRILVNKNHNFIEKAFHEFGCYFDASKTLNESTFISTFINTIYVCNIFAIFFYFGFKVKSDERSTSIFIQTSVFWGALIMFYLFIYLINAVVSYESKFFRDIAISFLVIGSVAFLLAYNLNAKDLALFYPGAEGELIKQILLFLPCIYIYIVDKIKEVISSSTPTSVIILTINTIIISSYIALSRLNLLTPKLLLNEPVYLNRENTIAQESEYVFENMDKDKYKKGISFWININKVQDRDRNYNIINITDKFKFTFNEKYEELKLQVHKLTDSGFFDNEVIFSYQNMRFQKWNNIILNYRNGNVDIFMNGNLVDSQPGVILNDVYSSIIVGQEFGINGVICNVKYYDNGLTLEKIKKIYNDSNNKNPPVI